MIKIQKNDDSFLAFDSSIDGAFAEGETGAGAIANLGEVVEMIEDWKKAKRSNAHIPITEINAQSSSFDFLAEEPDLYSRGDLIK